jgi:hypothetical protein
MATKQKANRFRSAAEKKVDKMYMRKPKKAQSTKSLIKNRTRDLDKKYGL